MLEIAAVVANISYKVTPNNLMGISGGSALSTTDTQAVQNKTLDNTNTITVKAANLTIQDGSDATKQAQFVASGITAGQTRSYTLPDASTTLVGTGTTQTLTAKTLTSPSITGGTIDNTTVTVDSIAGHTASTTGTIYGISVASGVITQANSVGAAALATNTISLGYAQVTGSGTVASATRSDLTTNPLSVTVTVPAGGRDVEISFFCGGAASSGAAATNNSIAIMESTTALAQMVWQQPVAAYNVPIFFSARVSAPGAGSHTYKIQAATSSGTITLSAGAANPAVATYGPMWILVKLI